MKKILLTGICSIFLFGAVKAQDTKWFSGISLGVALPSSDFASKDPAKETSGYALTGISTEVNVGYQFSKHFSLLAAVSSRYNGFDDEALENQYGLSGIGGSINIESKKYVSSGLMLGTQASFQFSKVSQLSLELRALAGLQLSILPEINFTANLPGIGSFNDTQKSTDASSFGYQFGAGFKYQLSNKASLKFSGDFNGNKPTFDLVDSTTGAAYTYKQPMNTINLMFGVVLAL